MASTTILSDNGVSSGSAGLKTQGGNDGTLLLQTTTSGGTATTAITIGTDQNITSVGNIRLNNGAADGAQLILASNGYSDWNIDNYNGNFRWYYNTTEYMRLDTSGNLGLGVTPSAWGQTGNLEFPGAYAVGYNGHSQNAYNSSGGWKYTTTAAASVYQQGSGSHKWFTAASGTAGNTISFTQAMTLDSSGNLLVGRQNTITLPSGSATSYFQNGVAVTNNTNTANYQLDRISFNAGQFYVLNGSSTGVILTSGSTAWAAQSDERTKDIIEPITNAAEKVLSLRAVIGKYKVDEDGTRRSFLIAQDVQAVLPEAVSASDDEQGTLNLRYSEVIPLLVAAIQEQNQLITQLQADVALLKGQQ